MEVLYEDGALAVFRKPAGVLSEGGPGSMTELAAAHFGGPAYPIHRLDTGVSGAMLFAKTPQAARQLSEDVRRHRVEKEYRAVISDSLAPPAGRMEDLLFKDAGRNKTYVVDRERKGVRRAVTEYRILAQTILHGRTASLASLEPKTGRSHQLRVQLASRRDPIFGDGKYGSREKCPLALFCHALTFSHPVTGRTVRVLCPMPDGFPWSEFSLQETQVSI